MFLNNFIMQIILYFYKFYYKILRRNRWNPQYDFLIPHGSIMHKACMDQYKRKMINKLRKKVFVSTITIVESGYYYIKSRKVVIDSGTLSTNSIFYSKKNDVSNIEKIACDTYIEVVNSDCLEEGVRLLDLGYNPAILNMASRHYPGGVALQMAQLAKKKIYSVGLIYIGHYINMHRLVKDLKLKCQKISIQWTETMEVYILLG